MKSKLNKLSAFLAILFLSLTVSCQHDDVLQDKKTDAHNHGLHEERLTFDELSAQLPKAKSIIDKINNSRAKNTKSSLYNEHYDFYINTDGILKIDNGNYHSLTFPVYRLEENYSKTENLVLSLQDDGSYYVALYSYVLTEQNKDDIINDKPTMIEGLIHRTPLSEFNPGDLVSRIVQTFYTQFIVVNCSEGKHHSGNIGEWHTCTADRGPKYYVITRSVLVDTGDDQIPLYGSETSQGGGIGGGSDPGTIPGFDPKDAHTVQGGITRPVILPPSSEQQFFNNVLDDSGRQVLQDKNKRKTVIDYLKAFGFTEDNMKKAKMIIDRYIETDDLDFFEWAMEYIYTYNLLLNSLKVGLWENQKGKTDLMMLHIGIIQT